MIIVRPFDAKDNAINTEQLNTLINYCKRHGEVIHKAEIYEMCVTAYTESGRMLIADITSNWCSAKHMSNYVYLKEEINGKHKRIKKSEY